MWHDSAVPGRLCAAEMIHPRSADASTTKLRPSTRRQLSLAGAASEQPKENDSGCPAVRFSQCHDEREAEIKKEVELSSRRGIAPPSNTFFLGLFCCDVVHWMVEMGKSSMFTTSTPDNFATELLAWGIKTLHWLHYLYLLNLRQLYLVDLWNTFMLGSSSLEKSELVEKPVLCSRTYDLDVGVNIKSTFNMKPALVPQNRGYFALI